MKVNKIKTHELEKCYSICPLTYNGTEHMLVAAEKVNKCLLFELREELGVKAEPGELHEGFCLLRGNIFSDYLPLK